jgi:hypothetical protein
VNALGGAEAAGALGVADAGAGGAIGAGGALDGAVAAAGGAAVLCEEDVSPAA